MVKISGPKCEAKKVYHKKYQRVQSSVLIPGKLIPESLHEDMSIVSSITAKNSIAMEKKSYQRSGGILGLPEKKTCIERRYS